ncbi:hypothetical protein EBBID32_38410 [Sphingobium indicum BiD32]|uniref:Uncharacterized protein n=1 Tax=Sphingobium indicum BiD32 TaxID=1301087 RepID=N1MRV8_9SPHN|nr:hypothetical protein EBBID32_38410 [Sphingobium indicum BiD32]
MGSNTGFSIVTSVKTFFLAIYPRLPGGQRQLRIVRNN